MENRTKWSDTFKKKVVDSEKNEYWLKDLETLFHRKKESSPPAPLGHENVLSEEEKKIMERLNEQYLLKKKKMDMENSRFSDLLHFMKEGYRNKNDDEDDDEGYDTMTENDDDDEEGYDTMTENDDDDEEGYDTMTENDDDDDDNGIESFKEGAKDSSEEGPGSSRLKNAEAQGPKDNVGEKKSKDKKKKKKKGKMKGDKKYKKVKKFFGDLFEKIKKVIYILLGKNKSFYEKTSEKIAKGLSENTATRKDVKFVYTYLCSFIALLISIFVFFNFYFLFYQDDKEFPNLTGWNSNTFYKEIRPILEYYFVDNTVAKTFAILFEVSFKSFINIIVWLHWLIPYFPHSLEIGSHIVLPNMFFIIQIIVESIHTNLFTFIKDLTTFNYNTIGKSVLYLLYYLLILMYVIFFTGKKVFNVLSDYYDFIISNPYISLFIFPVPIIIFIAVMILLSPILVFGLAGIYLLYYSFIPIIFYGKGLFGNIRDILSSLHNYTYQYFENKHDKDCFPSADNCHIEKTIQGLIKWSFVYLAEPAHIFFVRHMFTFIPLMFLMIMGIEAIMYVKSTILKRSLVIISIISSILLFFGGGWHLPMKIKFPIVGNERVEKDLKFWPLLGAIAFLIICATSYIKLSLCFKATLLICFLYLFLFLFNLFLV